MLGETPLSQEDTIPDSATNAPGSGSNVDLAPTAVPGSRTIQTATLKTPENSEIFIAEMNDKIQKIEHGVSSNLPTENHLVIKVEATYFDQKTIGTKHFLVKDGVQHVSWEGFEKGVKFFKKILKNDPKLKIIFEQRFDSQAANGQTRLANFNNKNIKDAIQALAEANGFNPEDPSFSLRFRRDQHDLKINDIQPKEIEDMFKLARKMEDIITSKIKQANQ